uniref:Alpha/beta hydrolase fold-3 domain-containing protein n=1 Tax=Leersia perrieri TaxID=77586 RepID=A0A0D9XE24_9ORYZ
MISAAAATNQSGAGNIAVDLFPFLRDGRIKKFVRHATVPASDKKTPNGVVTKDVVVDHDTGVSVRVFLPVDAAEAAGKLLPLVVYIHGGAFCSGSASAQAFHRYAETLVARAAAVVVSVDYRLAPEHPMPAGYDDAWAALRKLRGHHVRVPRGRERRRQLVHNVALRAEDGIDIEGIILLQPCFWGTERLPFEKPDAWRRATAPMLLPERLDALWPYVTAGAAGNDDPRIDPPAEAIASLPCRRALVTVATEDVLRDRGRRYGARLRDGAWGGEVTLVESEGEDHCFHLSPKPNPNAVLLMDHVAEFIAKGKTATPIGKLMMNQCRRRCTLHAPDANEKTMSRDSSVVVVVASWSGSGGRRGCSAQSVQKVQGFGSVMGSMRHKAHNYPRSAAGAGRGRINLTCKSSWAKPIRKLNLNESALCKRTYSSQRSMSTNKISSPARNESHRDGDLAVDLFPFVRVYRDGRIRRYVRPTSVPASGEKKSPNGVVTKDVVIDHDTGLSVRLFLPVDAATAAGAGRRLPLVLYFHGGGFCTGSATSPVFHRYAESLASRAAAAVVSVDYRVAPEHPVPAAYDDAWTALRWVASRYSDDDEPWVANYADTTCVFLAGESAGANIVHNLMVRLGTGGEDDGVGVDIDVEGVILLQPYFWGAERLPSEKPRGATAAPKVRKEVADAMWPFVTAGAAGNDDPRIDPPADAIASLPCRRALVTVATEDLLRDRGRQYAARLRDGAWGGEVTLVESDGEDHCFHLSPKPNPNTVLLMDHVADFIAKGKTTTTATSTRLLMKQQHGRLCTLHESDASKKNTMSSVVAARWGGSVERRCSGKSVLKVQSFGSRMGNMGPPTKAYYYPRSSAGLGKLRLSRII